jgi:hypothetical protein
MAPSPVLALSEHFAHLDDPRVERTRLQQPLDIVVIAICAVIAGAESWDDIMCRAASLFLGRRSAA